MAVAVTLFLAFWLSGMIAGLTAGPCLKERYTGEKKLRYCDISLRAGWVSAFPASERARRAPIHLSRGIALSQLGRDEDARQAFAHALRDASADTRVPSGRVAELHARISATGDAHAQALWRSVVTAR